MCARQRETTEIRQQQITDAALDIIGSKGIHGATIAEIATEVGISEGNIYRHFRNKEEILKSVIEKIGEDLCRILTSVQDTSDPLQRMGEIFHGHLAYAKSNKGIPRTLFSEEVMVIQESLREEIKKRLMSYFKGVCETIREGQRRGFIVSELNAEAVTSMFIGTINFTVIRWTLSTFQLDMEAEGKVLWETFMKSIAVDTGN
ncbi:MAG: TetR/AcrR family transcriptional regulator [Geobacter sp.]|nr:MAG: TetR/AcrR family transcriptional regulator [Geobacter sp.]